MLLKRTAIFCLFCALLAGQALAAIQHKIVFDPAGNLFHFWIAPASQEGFELKYEKSFDQGNIFDPPQTLYHFTREVEAFEVAANNQNLFISFMEKGKLFLAPSSDYGKTFLPPKLISENCRDPSLAVRNDLLAIAWEEDGIIKFASSEGKTLNLDGVRILQLTGEALSSPVLTIDQYNHPLLCFMSHDPNKNLNRILYSGTEGQVNEIYRSHDRLINLKIQESPQGVLLLWQNDYLGRYESYLCFSLDQDINFGKPKMLADGKEIMAVVFRGNRPSLISYDDHLIFKEIYLPPPPTPSITFPPPGTVINSAELSLNYSIWDNLPLLCRIDVSADENFSGPGSLSFNQYCSKETNELSLPLDLEEGSYYLRIHSFDGFSASDPSKILPFKVDKTVPQLISLEAVCAKGNITLSGKVSESPAAFTVNGEPVSLESDARFSSHFDLTSGNNLFTFILSDEAGNINILTKEVSYNVASPEITVSSSDAEKWYKPGSTILIQAQVFDEQGDVPEGAEAQVTINGSPLTESLSFYPEDNTLFGFITLPEDLKDGEHEALICLEDNAGNQGSVNIKIKIDTSPPNLYLPADGSCYSNSEKQILLPLIDEGAGVDPTGTIIKIDGISFEGVVSSESQSLVLTPQIPYCEGSYEVEVFPRDLIGNTGDAACFSLIIDKTPPLLTLLGTYETQTSQSKINLQAKIEDPSPVTVNIYNNRNQIDSSALSDSGFSKEIVLLQGENNILLEAADLAGNISSSSLKIFSNAAASGLITTCTHGPNPFSPNRKLPGAFSAQGKGMIFSYSLSRPANIKIMIFDIAGNRIWTKEIEESAAGVTAWNGVDQFGRMVGNGIYPYLFSATAGGITERRKSKIIVFHQ